MAQRTKAYAYNSIYRRDGGNHPFLPIQLAYKMPAMTDRMNHRLKIARISIASALLAAAVGGSYAYVDLSLNRMGVSATAIGLNAAMPALGWLLGTPLMPWALRRFPPRGLLLGLLAAAMLAVCLFPVFPRQDSWMALRFVFGGGAGLAFRLVEYWIGAGSPPDRRGRYVGIYSAAFAAGAMCGAGIMPAIGLEGWPPVLAIAGLTGASILAFAAVGSAPPAVAPSPGRGGGVTLTGAAFVALAGGLAIGLFEAVPYTLMPVYTVRLGLEENWGVWTASAFLLGTLLFPALAGHAADRKGKMPVIVLCAAGALAIAPVVPQVAHIPQALLAVMVLWGGFGGSLYAVSLAMLADEFEGPDLAAANAAFGTLYAMGSLCGPPLHGLAMDWSDPQGLMGSAATLFALFLVAVLWPARRAREGT